VRLKIQFFWNVTPYLRNQRVKEVPEPENEILVEQHSGKSKKNGAFGFKYG
jgi:hypothetical protein